MQAFSGKVKPTSSLRNIKKGVPTMARTRRSPCPVAGTLDILGDRWTLLVIRDLFRGCTQFKEFLRGPEKIATNVLSERLNRLQEEGLVERFPLAEQAAREGYRLTAKGRSLGPVLKAMADWGIVNIPGSEARLKIEI